MAMVMLRVPFRGIFTKDIILMVKCKSLSAATVKDSKLQINKLHTTDDDLPRFCFMRARPNLSLSAMIGSTA